MGSAFDELAKMNSLNIRLECRLVEVYSCATSTPIAVALTKLVVTAKWKQFEWIRVYRLHGGYGWNVQKKMHSPCTHKHRTEPNCFYDDELKNAADCFDEAHEIDTECFANAQKIVYLFIGFYFDCMNQRVCDDGQALSLSLQCGVLSIQIFE